MKTITPIQEKILDTSPRGLVALILNSLLILLFLSIFVLAVVYPFANVLRIILIIISSLYAFVVGPLLYIGLKIVKPNEAIVLTLFGRYLGTIKEPGFYWIHPLAAAAMPAGVSPSSGKVEIAREAPKAPGTVSFELPRRRISLKATTLNNDKQKVNDALGNPIIIGVVVVWRVVETAKALFNVENYIEFLSIQCDATLRNVVRNYPYDSEDDEISLRGSAEEVAQSLKEELDEKVEVAGLEILETRITHLSYSPEIAAAMLQRQQATAVIAARQKIVEGAVGMVELALTQLSEQGLVELDEERKATMVSNLMVVLCSKSDVQPVVNTGSIY